MESNDETDRKWGGGFDRKGFLPMPGSGPCGHRFGGDACAIHHDSRNKCDPTLILTIDLSDPLLEDAGIDFHGTVSLPFASFLDCDLWERKQEYRFSKDGTSIVWLSGEENPARADAEDRMESPLPPCPVILQPMDDADLPTTEEKYWSIGDEFLGGGKFIRLFGSPYWLQSPSREICGCGNPMQLALSVGYESWDEGAGRLSDRRFFIGEAGLYFFACIECSVMRVSSQST